jgi:hypothetical protein
MTRRSERRAAEQAVIDAAVKLARAGTPRASSDYGANCLALKHAVEALEALDFETPSGAPTNIDSPQTAHDAGEWMAEHAAGLAGQVLATIVRAWQGGGTGLATYQVEMRLGGKHESISPRVTQLRQLGFIVDSGERRRSPAIGDRKQGRPAIVWTPSQLIQTAVIEGKGPYTSWKSSWTTS